jgi:hypothetical protein
MPVENYLQEKMAIARLPRAQWKEALDRLDPAIRASITPWLRSQWQIASLQQRWKKTRKPPPLNNARR